MLNVLRYYNIRTHRNKGWSRTGWCPWAIWTTQPSARSGPCLSGAVCRPPRTGPLPPGSEGWSPSMRTPLRPTSCPACRIWPPPSAPGRCTGPNRHRRHRCPPRSPPLPPRASSRAGPTPSAASAPARYTPPPSTWRTLSCLHTADRKLGNVRVSCCFFSVRQTETDRHKTTNNGNRKRKQVYGFETTPLNRVRPSIGLSRVFIISFVFRTTLGKLTWPAITHCVGRLAVREVFKIPAEVEVIVIIVYKPIFQRNGHVHLANRLDRLCACMYTTEIPLLR